MDGDSWCKPRPLAPGSSQDAVRRPDRKYPAQEATRKNHLPVSHLQRGSSRSQASPPDNGWTASLTTNRKWSNSFRDPGARGGKLFPRARISGAASAAAAVGSLLPCYRLKEARHSGLEGKGPPLGRYSVPWLRGDASSVPAKFLPFPVETLGRGGGARRLGSRVGAR